MCSLPDFPTPGFRIQHLTSCAPPLLATELTNARVLEEIVVTAQKRERNVQNAAISVSAYDGRFAVAEVCLLTFDAASEVITSAAAWESSASYRVQI